MSLPAWAAQYVGLPFLERGRTREGLDCWGLVRLVLSDQYGIEVPSYLDRYEVSTQSDILGPLIEEERQGWDDVPLGAAREGDVLILRVRGRGSHVGVVLGGGKMLHVEEGIGVVVEGYEGPMWGRRVLGAVRARKVPVSA